MKFNKQLVASIIAAFSISFANAAETPVAKADSLDELLNIVRTAEQKTTKENQQRLQVFRAQKNRQQTLLREAQAQLVREERRSEVLKESFDTNEASLGEMSNQLRIKLGNLGEAVGVVRQVAAEAAATVSGSIVSAQLPGRSTYLDELAQRKAIPTIPELRRLWVELQTEMTQQGKITRYTGELLDKNGIKVSKSIDRIGTFNMVSDGEYVIFNDDSGNVEQISRQPKSGEYGSRLSSFQSSSEFALLPLDRSQGAIVVTETRRDTWVERVREYAGVVGFAILVVGALGLVIALERLITLSSTGSKMNKQRKTDEPGNNPLGRVMAVYRANKDDSIENLELKLDEAVLKELPKIEARISIIKIFAAVSPLMGLLGTVTGMIETFQGITLYGSGDPSVMATGISQALITTVLGIVSAIPLILAHAVVSGKSKSLVHVLEEQSAGLVAQHSEGK